MAHPCPDDCGRTITNWTQACYPTAPWDTPRLPPRAMHERCTRHNTHSIRHGHTSAKTLCAYRDDDPRYCPRCHATPRKCSCTALF